MGREGAKPAERDWISAVPRCYARPLTGGASVMAPRRDFPLTMDTMDAAALPPRSPRSHHPGTLAPKRDAS